MSPPGEGAGHPGEPPPLPSWGAGRGPGPPAASATTDPTSCQDASAARLACYYAAGDRRPPRPHCEGVAVVAYGPIRLCRSCDTMRSAVGRTDAPRPAPGAELLGLIAAARGLAAAEEHLVRALRQARAAGATWSQVGDATGVSRQAAQQRWSARSAPADA